jgi:hypothetical protein
MTAAANEDLVSHHEIGVPRLNETKGQPSTKVVPIGENDVSSTNGIAPETVKRETPELLSGTAPAVSYPKSRLELLDHFIDEPRPLRVAVIGGGLAGILAGILLPVKVPGIKLTIYEKNHDLVSLSGSRPFRFLKFNTFTERYVA